MQTTIEARFLGFYPLSRLTAHERHSNPVYTREPFWRVNPSILAHQELIGAPPFISNNSFRLVAYYPAVHSVVETRILGQAVMLLDQRFDPAFERTPGIGEAVTIAELSNKYPIRTFQRAILSRSPWPDIVCSNRPFHIHWPYGGVVRGFSFNTWETANQLLSDPRLAPWIIRLSGLKLRPQDYLSLIAPLKPVTGGPEAPLSRG